jgi:hypothetical protein
MAGGRVVENDSFGNAFEHDQILPRLVAPCFTFSILKQFRPR